jgi:ATP-binding cassette subfamily C protein
MDIILGFLEPESGQILIDGKAAYQNITGWQKQIGFVPQHIFVMDDTIRRNIAFAVDDNDIDDQRLKTVLEMTQLDQFVEGFPDGMDAMLGEHGTRLSGGQRQRIAIARALYHDPAVLLFDEATSALDNITEQEITRAIDNLAGRKTILIVAHRLSTVRKCDDLVFMKDGAIDAIGTYDELVKNNAEFRHLAELGESNKHADESPPA